jgi:thiol-disulfide isomerase/thioredoxin
MLTVNLGPLSVPLTLLLLMVALLVAAQVGHVIGRAQKTGIVNILSDMLIAAVLTARIAFVVLWFDTYRSAPWSMLDIRDGGFSAWAGMGAALLVALWRGWRMPAVRKPLMLGLAAGVLVWGATMYVGQHLTQNPTLPTESLTTLAGSPTDLAEQAGGLPMVVNLWATWCPPCRREMPVLAAAQKRETGVRFVFVNQGEDRATAQRYLNDSQLDLANVLLDPGSHLGRAVGSGSLPTTLFYDASGDLVDTHLGAVSAASLASKLNHLHSRPLR